MPMRPGHGALDLVERNLVITPIIEACRPRAFVVRYTRYNKSCLSEFKSHTSLSTDKNSSAPPLSHSGCRSAIAATS